MNDMYAFVNTLNPIRLPSGRRHARSSIETRSPFCNSHFTPRWVTPTRKLPTLQRTANLAVWMCEPSANKDANKENIPPRELSPAVKELRSLLKKCSIYLIGPMGCGKSAVGKYVAFELGFRYLDTDTLIENVAQKPISEIFATEGEEAFRALESSVLEQVTPFIACCVSTGGGIVIRKDNWGKLQTGIVVYLQTPVDVLQSRLQGESESGKRPLLKDAVSLRDRITDILHEREHLYKQADVTIDCKADMAVDAIGQEIIRSLTNFIKANPPKLSTLYTEQLPKK